jgi:phosphoglycerate dehydrogenase-like enzyme
MKTVAVLDDYQNVALSFGAWDAVRARANVTVLNRHIADEAELAAQLAHANIIVCNRERTKITKSLIEKLPHLELIVTSGMRNASIDVEAAIARGITVCGTNTLGYPTAELTWSMILAFMRNLPNEVNSLVAGGWQTKVGTGLRGKTLGIIGLGRIGTDVAKVGQAFGMKVIAWSRSLTPEKAAALGIECVTKEELMKRADVSTIHLALDKDTRGLVGAPQLALMKPTALIVNTSRSPIIDVPALIAALKAGQIGGAALDVYDREPLAKDDPIRSAPNTLLTPHLGYVIAENYDVTYGQSVENILAWMDGKPVRVIDPNAPQAH